MTRKHATNAQFVDALERARRTIRARASEASTSASAQDGLRELMSTVGFVRASTGRRGRRMFGEDARAKTLERDGGGGARRESVSSPPPPVVSADDEFDAFITSFVSETERLRGRLERKQPII